MKLPKILIHPGNGDASFLIDGYKLPPGAVLLRGYEVAPVTPDSPRSLVGVTVTFLADEVTVIDLTRDADRKDNQ